MLASYISEIVRPTVKEYLENPTDRRRCFLACIAMFHVTDRIAGSRIENCKSPEQACQFLKQECTAFAVVEDVALAFKHLQAGGGDRVRATERDVITRPPATWGEAVQGLSRWNDSKGGVEARRTHDSVDVTGALSASLQYLMDRFAASAEPSASKEATISNASITLEPIGFVRGGRKEALDDQWGAIEAQIQLDPARFSAEATQGLDAFSHVVVVFHMDKVPENKIEYGARHPRERADWPKVGIFAQPARSRPNRVGVTICQLVKVDGLTLHVRGLDAIDGTPVIDVKPHLRGFAARGEAKEPAWASELMRTYW